MESTQYLQNLTFPRGYHTAHKFENNVFVFGGYDSDSFSARPIGAIEKYDVENNVWSVVANLNSPRGCCGTSVYKNKVYIPGGWGDEATIEVFDPFDCTITVLDIQLSQPGPSISIAIYNYILIIHGNTVSKLYPDRNQLIQVVNIPQVDKGYFSMGTPVVRSNKVFMCRA